MTDGQLLSAFAERRDQSAFRELVSRYAGVVYAAARRQVRDPATADDVVQATFVLLARKAGSINPATVAGWLMKTARLVAMSAKREEARRSRRQREYAAMQIQSTDPSDPAVQWGQVSPELDAALARLADDDRTVVTLRYLRGMSSAEVAAATGVSEEAARKRVQRALERLRTDINRRGVLTAVDATLASLLLAHGQLAVPTSLIDKAVAAGFGAPTATVSTLATATTAAARTAVAIKAGIAALAAVVVIAVIAVARPSPTAPKQLALADPTPAPASTVAIPTTRPTSGPLRIGFLVSEFTVSGPGGYKQGGPFNHPHPRVIPLLEGPGTELWAVVEPNTQNISDIAQIVQDTFEGRVLDGSRADQLATLDVLVTAGANNMRPEVLDAMLVAVRDRGIGFLRWNEMGYMTPGPIDPRVRALCGLAGDGPHAHRFSGRWEDCEIVGTHAILGNLSGTHEVVRLRPQTRAGPLTPDAVPLVQAKSTGFLDPARYAIYTTQPGKGRILHFAFAHFTQIPPDFDRAVGGHFMQHCLEWLARRPMPATRPAGIETAGGV